MDNTARFTGKSDVYARFRPSYPAAFVDDFMACCGLREGSAVADVGSGTGILTRLLLERGLTVYAVEPNAEMRAVAEQDCAGLSGFHSVAAGAEETGLAAGSVDAVTAAQAFHWFDAARFRLECRRILKPGGQVCLVWNRWDTRAALLRENEELKRLCPGYRGAAGGTDFSGAGFEGFFRNGEWQEREFFHVMRQDRAGFIGGNLSSSYAPRPGDPIYERYVALLGDLFDRHAVYGMVELPMLCRSYTGAV